MNDVSKTIGWAQKTWNIITGCLGPNGTPSKAQRCPYCYAHRLARGRLKKLYLNNLGDLPVDPELYWDFKIPGADPNDPFTPRYWSDRHIEPYELKKPSKIFVCSMGELFGNFVPVGWIRNVLEVCLDLPRHTFQILTKNPKRALDFAFPDNVWLGVTVTSFLDWLRVCLLQSCQAKLKFISFEPLLDDALNTTNISLRGIDWVIIGAQTRPDLQPNHSWVYRIIDAARHEGIPIFLKPNLHWPGPPIQEFPSDLILRRKVEASLQPAGRIQRQSGELSHQITDHRGSPNDKILH